MRLFEATGVGSCLLTDSKANMADLFVAGQEVVVFDSAEDCMVPSSDGSWTTHVNAERIAAAGQQRTMRSALTRARNHSCRTCVGGARSSGATVSYRS